MKKKILLHVAIEKFYENLNGKARRTIMTYTTALNRFEQLMEPRLTIDRLAEPSNEHVVAFANSIKNLKADTRNVYLSAIHQFIQYLTRNDLIVINDSKLAETINKQRPKSRHDVKASTREFIDKLLAEIKLTPSPHKDDEYERKRYELPILRDTAIVLCLLESGARISELVGLHLKDLDWEHKATHVTGKGNKYQTIFSDAMAWQALTTYLSR